MTIRPSFQKLWAKDGETTDPSAKYNEGWLHGEKPEHQHQNYLQQQEELLYLYASETGVPSWFAEITYPVHAIVFEGEKWYRAKSASTNKRPPSVEWELIHFDGSYQEAINQITELRDKVYDHTGDRGNPHNVSPEILGIYTSEEVNGFILKERNILNSHEEATNPHKVTAAQVGALPLTGGDFNWVDFDVLQVLDTEISAGNDFVKIEKDSNTLSVENGDAWYNDYHLVHDGNFEDVRTISEPLFHARPADIIIPFSNNLFAFNGLCDVVISWDTPTFDNLSGLHCEGEITFDAIEGIGQELTISVQLKGECTFTVGNVTITLNGSSIRVEDGINTLQTNETQGLVTYTRTSTKGYLYVNGILKAEKSYNTSTTTTECSFSGSGYIKAVQLWSTALTKEQVAHTR